MATHTLYTERSWNPLAFSVRLGDDALRIGRRGTPVGELHMVAMAEAYLRGQWLGGGGAVLPLHSLPDGPGVVPVTRFTGSAKPVRVQRAREFADAIGALALRLAGGPEAVRAQAEDARAADVPLWIARRTAVDPAGRQVLVAVDRRLVRADVWGAGLPTVRLRGPYGMRADRPDPTEGIEVRIDGRPAALHTRDALRKSRRILALHAPSGQWEVTRKSGDSSWLRRDGRTVAVLSRPPAHLVRASAGGLLPLTAVDYRDVSDGLDVVMPHFVGVAFGIGDATGKLRFGARRREAADDGPVGDESWSGPWLTSLGRGRDDWAFGGYDGGGGSDGSGGGDSSGGEGGDGGGGGGGGE